jgi:23S rRNA (uracil1939-C5)-methyltransferase
MTLTPGTRVDLVVEKPAAGGRMIARHDGQVIFVLGAIPGERVSAIVERVEKRLAFASVAEVLEASPDRRATSFDPRCGGCLYAHIGYARQVAIKSAVLADAFARLGKIPLESAVPVAASPEQGYRMRARFHVRAGRAGFYREGTHEMCDAAVTGQLLPESFGAVDRAVAALHAGGVDARSVELTENLAADQRALYVEMSDGGADVEAAFVAALDAAGLVGCTGRTPDGSFVYAGVPEVTDPLGGLTAGRATEGTLGRSPESFFQGNRFLLPSLVTTVLDAVPPSGDVLDLYAGVGLFTAALAATGRTRLTAVEGDRASGSDLRRNARQWPAVRAVVGGVEEYLADRRRPRAETIVVDPPRAGISKEAVGAIARHGARRIVYVSCDPATMARDARRLLDSGYRLGPLTAFDLFPNTPHVETVGVFERSP